MRLQPNRDYTSDDVVQTPPEMAQRIVNHLKPTGSILEPCKGAGNFLNALPPGTHWCEISEGRDFLAWRQPVDWIITNPPWSQIRVFLNHAMSVADNVVFLLTINHVWTRARVRDVAENNFAIREIMLLEMPPEFPQSGFQLGAVHLQRDWSGPATITDLSKPTSHGRKRRGRPVTKQNQPSLL